MRVLNVRSVSGPSTIAWFDLEIGNADVRVLNCQMKRNQKGQWRVYAPSPDDRRLVTFSPDFAEQVIDAVLDVTGRRAANGAN